MKVFNKTSCPENAKYGDLHMQKPPASWGLYPLTPSCGEFVSIAPTRGFAPGSHAPRKKQKSACCLLTLRGLGPLTPIGASLLDSNGYSSRLE